MKKILTLILFLCLSACFGGVSPTSQFYTLESVSNVKPLSDKKITIGIGGPDIPSYLDRTQMVFNDGANVTISETHRWVESFGKLFSSIVINDMNAYLPNAIIQNKMLSVQPSKINVSIQVSQFSAKLNSDVLMSVLWTISDEDENVLSQQRATLKANAGSSYAEYSSSVSRLAGQLAEKISKSLLSHF